MPPLHCMQRSGAWHAQEKGNKNVPFRPLQHDAIAQHVVLEERSKPQLGDSKKKRRRNKARGRGDNIHETTIQNKSMKGVGQMRQLLWFGGRGSTPVCRRTNEERSERKGDLGRHATALSHPVTQHTELMAYWLRPKVPPHNSCKMTLRRARLSIDENGRGTDFTTVWLLRSQSRSRRGSHHNETSPET